MSTQAWVLLAAAIVGAGAVVGRVAGLFNGLVELRNNVEHVFFLSDTTEWTAADLMQKTVTQTWKFAGLLAAMSGLLLWLSWGAPM